MVFTTAILTFVVLVIKLIVQIFVFKSVSLTALGTLSAIVNAFVICVTIIIVAIPEGLPVVVTVSLAYSVLEMNDLGNLVRRFNACETMASVNEIITDKTGVLTQNKFAVLAFYFLGKKMQGDKCDGFTEMPKHDIAAEAILYNSSALISEIKDPKTKQVVKTATGNVTDCGMINFLMKSGVPCESMIANRNKPNH